MKLSYRRFFLCCGPASGLEQVCKSKLLRCVITETYNKPNKTQIELETMIEDGLSICSQISVMRARQEFKMGLSI